MRIVFGLIFILVGCFSIAQQGTMKMYQWDEVVNADPDTVFALTLSKMKLEKLPDDLCKFTSLVSLDLSKNKLNDLPEYIGEFAQLKHLNIGKNQFATFPIEVCRLQNLQELIANRNAFNSIPKCIAYCTKLEVLDLWETPVHGFPEELNQIKNPLQLDLRGVKYSPTFQRQFKEKFPNILVKFDPPCDCME